MTRVICVIMNIQGGCWLCLRYSGLDPLNTYLLITFLYARYSAGIKRNRSGQNGQGACPFEVSALTEEVQIGHHCCVL